MTAPIRVYFDGGPKHGETEVMGKDLDAGLLYDGPKVFAYYRTTREAIDTPDGQAQVLRYQGERPPSPS